jgi:hypothetical protein
MSAEERRKARESRRKEIDAKPKRTGRGKNDERLERATREENVYPEDVAADACQFSHSRPIWRLLDGKATLVAYHIYRSGNRFGQIVGGVRRTEFGVEIHVALAHLVYATGLSIEKACEVLGFFQELALSRSQANPHVDGTNNAAERELRGAATARSTGRTNKSFNGARRRTIVVSVLLSLGKQLGSLRLREIVDEVNRWVAHGKSCFEELVEQSEIEPRGRSVLDIVCPKPG